MKKIFSSFTFFFSFSFFLVACFLLITPSQATSQIATYTPGVKKTIGWTGSMELDLKEFMGLHFVVVPRSARANNSSKSTAHEIIRTSIIKQLLQKNAVDFIQKPYTWNANFALTVKSGAVVTTSIEEQDDLDLIINNALIRIWTGQQNIIFSKTDIEALGKIYLRKNTQDLKNIGYQVASSRYRTNYDPSYRRHNIITAFSYLGHIRVLNPGDEFAYLASINYDPKTKKNYKNGLAIVNDDEIPVYGGGLCGGSTAIYQGLVTNTALKLSGRNHSKRFTNLYTATINGKKISTPGIDLTIFAGSTDLIIKNISDHPIILAFNFNGNYGGIEEILSIGLVGDQGSLEFVGQKTSYKQATHTNYDTKEKYTETVKTGCYTRKINGINKTSCYKEVH